MATSTFFRELFFLRCDSLFNPIASGLADECLPLLTTYSDRQGFADLFSSLRLILLLFLLDKVLLLRRKHTESCHS